MGLFNENSSRVAITVDKWISCEQNKRYIAITGQITDDDWKVKRRMMRFVYVPYAFTNEIIAKLTVECLFDWDVASKISTITIDYESDEGRTDTLADQLSRSSLLLGGKLLHMRCFARTMSLMVKEGFDVIGNVIEKIRESILFWTATPQREGAFKEASRELSISDTDSKLSLDSVSKWNTTFLMLQTTLLLKPVFCHLKKQELEYLCMPSEDEWELAKEILGKLRLLYIITNRVSKYRSANFFFFELCRIKLDISDWVTCTNELVKNMALKMQEIFDKYWNSVRDIFAVASVLDHRFKLFSVETFFEKIYGDGSQKEVEHIRQILCDLFNEYQSKMSPKKTDCDDNPSSGSDDLDSFARYKKFLREKRKREQLDEKPELEAYLEKEAISVDARVGEIVVLWTDIKDSYSVTNSYSWGTSDNYAVVEHEAAEEAKLAQPRLSNVSQFITYEYDTSKFRSFIL